MVDSGIGLFLIHFSQVSTSFVLLPAAFLASMHNVLVIHKPSPNSSALSVRLRNCRSSDQYNWIVQLSTTSMPSLKDGLGPGSVVLSSFRALFAALTSLAVFFTPPVVAFSSNIFAGR